MGSGDGCSRFANLRGVRWRMNLGILPSSFDESVDNIRRVTANSRRRYAILRRQLLTDPKFSKDGEKSRDLTMDNPLSQNPDSTWGRFFHNAELEKLVEQDLSRLYPDEGSFLQSQPCQAMIRRILLAWCLQHPVHGYRQGMHELMAPLIYVLHVDVQLLSQVRKLYPDYFNDEFDGRSFKYKIKKNSWNEKLFEDDEEEAMGYISGRELDEQTKDMIHLNDAYGAEGELGIVLSERFMEHDAYSMFDAVMKGAQGVVAIADFFSPYPSPGSSSGLSPVIEASSAVYQLLSAVDSVLHCHLADLGVEPQYFTLRWLRVLFGREFMLQDLLIVWDEIFSSSNEQGQSQDLAPTNFTIFSCARGKFIASLAVSMILRLRSSLLAAENATICLQRLLNSPEKANLKKLIEKARSLQEMCSHLELSLEINDIGPTQKSSAHHARHYSLSSGSVSPATPHRPPPVSYWEEKWQVLHRKSEDFVNGFNSSSGRSTSTPLLKTLSDTSPVKSLVREKESLSAVRRRLFAVSSISPSTNISEQKESRFKRRDDPSPKLVSGTDTDENEAVSCPVVERVGCGEEVVKGRRVAAPSRFQWLWKFGRDGGKSIAEDVNGDADLKGDADVNGDSNVNNDVSEAVVNEENSDPSSSEDEVKVEDVKVMGSLKDLGQAMMDNIQTLESTFQADRGTPAAAIPALAELRKISQRLFEI